MSYGALGLVEVLGSCNAVVVLDQMLKTSDVEFRTWHTKCGGHATVFLSGDVAAVKPHNFASNYAEHMKNARKYWNALNERKIFK